MLKNLARTSFILKADFIVFLLCLAGLYQSAQKAGIPARLQMRNGQIWVTEIKSPSHRQGLQPGDRILAVNGHSVFTPDDVEFLLDGQSIGQTIRLTVQRKEQTETISLRLQRENSVSYLFVLGLVGFIFFGLGIVVLLKRPPGDTVALVFHWLSVTVALHITNTFGCYTIPPWHLGYFLRIIFLLASALTPVLFVHFSFLFPRKKWPDIHEYFKAFYLLALVLFAYLAGLFLRAAQLQSVPIFHQFMTVYNLGRWLFAIGFLFAVGNFIHSYITAKEEAERRKLRWVILGLAIGPSTFVLFWQLPQTFEMAPLVSEEAMLLVTALTPLTFAISVVRYHLLDIDVIFNRSTVYFFVLAILLGLYAAIVGLTAMLVQYFTVKISLLVSAVAAVILAILFEPLRKSVQKFVDRRFFRVRYNYRLAQREFTQRMERCLDINSLTEFLLEKVNELMQPLIVAFYLKNSNGGWRLIRAENSEVEFDSQFLRNLQKMERNTLLPVIAAKRFVEAGIAFAPADIEVFKKNKVVLALPLRLQNAQTVGFLILGKKKSAALYSREDIDLLKTFVQQAALAIERIQLQQKLLLKHAETKRLEELNALKSYFVSSVSHDLQTPLTSIRMFAELLQNSSELSDDQKEYLEIIQGESERLARLIRNVLDFSRLERGVKTYRSENVDLNDVVQSVMRSMKYQLKQSHFETRIEISQIPVMIQGDADAIAEAVENLISNAIKYSKEQKFLGVRLRKQNDSVVIEVEDHGIGIDPKEQSHIFETYYRAKDAHVQAMGGAGLGLSLVKQIMEAHGGKVEVQSTPGKGSTFRLIFPLNKK